ncbi:13656_t:CDS:2, partial [Entrophospora sp. SA101]
MARKIQLREAVEENLGLAFGSSLDVELEEDDGVYVVKLVANLTFGLPVAANAVDVLVAVDTLSGIRGGLDGLRGCVCGFCAGFCA